MKHFIGVDGGGSKTAALVIDENQQPLGHGLAGASNHLRVGIETATRNIERAVNIALVEAGIAIRNVDYAYCGIAGADHPAHHQRVVDSLRIFFPGGNFIVDTDARIALTGAVGFGSGVVVISGTGSVAFGRNESGEEGRAGGWGPTIGDEGSGYAIARDGLSAIVRAHDGRGKKTKMTEMLCYDYDMCSPEDLPRFVYATTTHADDIARYGKLVIQAALQGDEVANEILDRAGRELGECVLAVARRLNLSGSGFPVAYVGGAFNAGELLLGPMKQTLDREAPGAALTKPTHTPVEGAAMMAIRTSLNPRPSRRGTGNQNL
ncbi:MAG TPA: BadF/BadG/BcrA/BcrD ATPase family protein [Thermoanaerobaculia bacterium]|nr:BadF/BadG/BcrA/BcrD ATPase family protein [Thermoanaerobaculia bacterium]